jgi:RHS repeat-associated protein
MKPYLLGACLLTLSPLCTTARGGSALDAVAGSAFEEPLVRTAPTSREEDATLLRAIQSYQRQPQVDDFGVLDRFLADHPGSGWRAALLTNLGLAYYHYGYFSRAMDSWQQAWNAGRSATEPRAKALVDRAIGELVKMHARIGHAQELETLFRDLGDRPVSGRATEAVQGAREALWMFHHRPGIAYLCGPMALRNLLLAQGASYDSVKFLSDVRSGPHGVSLAEVAHLAGQAKLPYRLIFRKPGQPIPVPSLVHWKVTHFAAIVEESDGRYHTQDPTFGSDLWVTRGALESESSGYFLAPATVSAAGWRDVREVEAANIRGMGATTANDPGATTPCDSTIFPLNFGPGMATCNVHEMVVSISLNDTPVGYTPPKGPDMHVTLTFNQREATQPANFAWFNVSPKWTLNWLSYIEDDPANAKANVTRYVAGGGSVGYPYVTKTNSYQQETRDASLLVRTSSTPVAYERRLANGGREVYAQSNGAAKAPRRVFLSQIVDPAGNTVKLAYDSQMRLIGITDATNRVTTFSYELAGHPLLVTRIADPFGRSATIDYDANGLLRQITDVLGLTSQFTYDASGIVNAMTTPYGTTTFAYAQQDGILGLGTFRNVLITDPLGQQEKIEFRHYATGVDGEPASGVPTGNINVVDDYIWFRDTYYWDKHNYATQNPNSLSYVKAPAKHWLHISDNQNVTDHIVESMKRPNENRIWFNYPNQGNAIISGTLDKISKSARVMDDGKTTQLSQVTYNTMGHVTKKIDPMGRETDLVYDTNQIDLLQVQQKIATGLVTLATFTYNTQHRPLTIKDAAGQTTRFAYNTAGQLTQMTDALGQITRYEYDPLGYLTRIVNLNGQTGESRTWDMFGRILTRTDSEGRTISYTYDVLDRITQESFPDGSTRQYTWDKLDLVSVTDRQGRIYSYTYDVLRNLTSVTDPLGRTTTLGYYENGRLKSLTDANGNTTSWDIDLNNRITARHNPDGTTVTTIYENTTSRVKSITDALGQTKQFTYTLDGLLAGIDYANAANPTPSVKFTYDPYFRRLVSMTDGSGTTQFTYVPPGSPGALRPAMEAGPTPNGAISWKYDALGRVVAQTVGSSTDTFTYDALGRMTTHASDLGTFDLTYLGQTGRIASRVLRGAGLETDWAWDSNTNDRRLTGISNAGASRSYQYTITPENVVTQIAETAAAGSPWPARTWTYSYDDGDRLLQGSASGGPQYTYGYDNTGNILAAQNPAGKMNAGYDAQNQVMALNGQSYTYDANGNVTDDGVRSYAWDAENRPLSITMKTAGQTTGFTYDGFGRRVGITAADGTVTRYQWCGRVLCQARDATDAVVRRYYAEGELTAAGGMLYAVDHLGSVRDVVAAADGARLASYDYDPYGNLAQSDGQAGTDLRYSGMFYLQSAGVYLTRFRVYDPGSGRWLSRDPIGQIGGINLYAYSTPNPVAYSDPSGRSEGLGGWLTDQGIDLSGKIAETGIENVLEPYVPDDEAKFIAAGLVGVAKMVAESRGLLMDCPECIIPIFLYYGFESRVEDAAKQEGISILKNLWQQLQCSQSTPRPLNIEPASIVSPWFLNPTVQNDVAPLEPGDAEFPLTDLALPDSSSLSPTKPFIVYFLGPFGRWLQLSIALGSQR